ncbi:MAG: hypothetical protein RIQ33_2093 [Bacteroidota bacterium]|jgi:hypothetical protein
MKILSETEISAWNNSNIFKVKQNVIQCICEANANTIDEIKNLNPNLFNSFRFKNPKISKGENYLNLPWVMADYPAYFDAENIFAYRMFYLWGTEINFFMLLKGDFLKHYQPTILSQIKNNIFENIFIYMGDDAWKHTIDEPYQPIKQIKIEQIIAQINSYGFLKLAVNYSPDQINNIENLGFEAWQLYYKLLSA